ncbi:response regulator transcription factor [Amycolatopsis cynarae]|uniref:Response regulator transcription factor n=1 Tax=Amycolatopsis cynarae TaxID=2995223 RepID=A0ABY7AWF5_9PSEU|nr:response regulator transcription factor [Amycolatopsis sp. HUAS 11-8]WAL63262.1 response regulator transcription factor [Amycolatopsis sp. HUAS 11-8]
MPVSPDREAKAARAEGDAPAPRPELLLVEDDDAIAEPLAEGLSYAGFGVRRVSSGDEALQAPPADLVLLDLGLPDVDGNEVCRRLRAKSAAPVIVVTARGEELDRVLLLELGADDYVVKPFGFRELVARIHAVLRRSGREAAAPREELSVGALRIDLRARRVWLGERELELTGKEFDLLSYLAAEPGTVRRREDIIAEVWDENWWGPTKTLDVHIAGLRRKLGDPGWISTLRGVGYRLNEPA